MTQTNETNPLTELVALKMRVDELYKYANRYGRHDQFCIDTSCRYGQDCVCGCDPEWKRLQSKPPTKTADAVIALAAFILKLRLKPDEMDLNKTEAEEYVSILESLPPEAREYLEQWEGNK